MIQSLGIPRPDPASPEIRESFTSELIARLADATAGLGDGRALAAIETSARWWGFGLASARLTPSSRELASITPSVLDTMGRSLCRSGESLHVIAVRQGRVLLTPTASWIVHGNDDPSTWLYRVTLNGPDTSRTFTIPAASVVHVRFAPHPARPWSGRSPLQMAIDTGRAASLLGNRHGRQN